jgi:hypothetical protein
MSNVSLTRPFMSSSELLRRLDVTSSMGSYTWEDPARVRVVAQATTRRRRDRVVLYVMYLCHKTTTMYCCEDYGLLL